MKTLLHLSFNGYLPRVLKPRQPDGSDFTKPKTIYTETLPDRVSFAPTVQGCINATYANWSKLFEESDEPHLYAYVYAAVPTARTRFIPPEVLADNLWDYHLTGEVATTTPVIITKVARIKITNPYAKGAKLPRSKEVYGRAYDDPANEERFIAPIVEYKVVGKYSSVSFQ